MTDKGMRFRMYSTAIFMALVSAILLVRFLPAQVVIATPFIVVGQVGFIIFVIWHIDEIAGIEYWVLTALIAGLTALGVFLLSQLNIATSITSIVLIVMGPVFVEMVILKMIMAIYNHRNTTNYLAAMQQKSCTIVTDHQTPDELRSFAFLW